MNAYEKQLFRFSKSLPGYSQWVNEIIHAGEELGQDTALPKRVHRLLVEAMKLMYVHTENLRAQKKAGMFNAAYDDAVRTFRGAP